MYRYIQRRRMGVRHAFFLPGGLLFFVIVLSPLSLWYVVSLSFSGLEL